MSLLHSAFILLALGILATGCGDGPSTLGANWDDGAGLSAAGDWTLSSVGHADFDIPLDRRLDLTIAEGELRGTGGCNSFFGTVRLAGDGQFVVSDLAMTEMGCLPTGIMEFESAYVGLLSTMTAWAITPDGLLLTGPGGELGYVPAAPPVHRPLSGTQWNFDSVYDGTGPDRSVSNRPDMDGVTLTISGDTAVVAGPSCAGTSFTFGYEGVATGRISVPSTYDLDDSDECHSVAEAADGVIAASGLMIDENRLTFVGDAGETVGFSAEP